MSELDRLKLILDIPRSDKTKDEMLLVLIDQAREYVLSYCRLDFADETVIPVMISMAAEDFGRIGSEGVSYRSISGTSEGYRNDYSPRIMSRLRRHRRIGGPSC